MGGFLFLFCFLWFWESDASENDLWILSLLASSTQVTTGPIFIHSVSLQGFFFSPMNTMCLLNLGKENKWTLIPIFYCTGLMLFQTTCQALRGQRSGSGNHHLRLWKMRLEADGLMCSDLVTREERGKRLTGGTMRWAEGGDARVSLGSKASPTWGAHTVPPVPPSPPQRAPPSGCLPLPRPALPGRAVCGPPQASTPPSAGFISEEASSSTVRHRPLVKPSSIFSLNSPFLPSKLILFHMSS